MVTDKYLSQRKDALSCIFLITAHNDYKLILFSTILSVRKCFIEEVINPFDGLNRYLMILNKWESK